MSLDAITILPPRIVRIPVIEFQGMRLEPDDMDMLEELLDTDPFGRRLLIHNSTLVKQLEANGLIARTTGGSYYGTDALTVWMSTHRDRLYDAFVLDTNECS